MKKLCFQCLWAIWLVAVMVGCGSAEEGGRYVGQALEESPKEAAAPPDSPKEEAAPDAKPNQTDSDTAPRPVEVYENPFEQAAQTPFSTFAVDVDNASYTQTRRFILDNGTLPPPQLVRLEEFVNYFDYDYALPRGSQPFSTITELGDCPWNSTHKLLHIGLKGKEIPNTDTQPSNLVFLIDVSGSMADPNKLPLLKKSFRYLLDRLSERDRVSIVVYAGAAGLVLPPTSDKQVILNALTRLESGGSTAGGEGLRLAYQIAEQNLLPNGNNRIILASDGDFNVGETSLEAMEQLVAEKRDKNIFITVLGFGDGNYQDQRMEIIANKGNGNYYYIDHDNEARKVFGTALTGTLFTIAKDVKVQVEFNPAVVKSYRLLGYENRMLNKEDFENDKKDAGEIGAGHSVTALYEVELVNTATVGKLATLNLRYKMPKGTQSELISQPIGSAAQRFERCSADFRFSASVVGFGMLLRQSKYKGKIGYADIERIASAALTNDQHGYRREFVEMVKKAASLVQ